MNIKRGGETIQHSCWIDDWWMPIHNHVRHIVMQKKRLDWGMRGKATSILLIFCECFNALEIVPTFILLLIFNFYCSVQPMKLLDGYISNDAFLTLINALSSFFIKKNWLKSAKQKALFEFENSLIRIF